VEQQAFIDASLGPREFCRTWNNKKEQQHNKQGKWKHGNLYQKSKKDSNTMKVNVTQLQETKEKVDYERQWLEGWCFLCNKQGHLKRNCPQNGREVSLIGTLCMPIAQTTLLERSDAEDMAMQMEGTTYHKMEEMLTKLQGMGLSE